MPTMRNSLPSLLFPEYRRRVLCLLLLRPDEALHGREIARRTGLPAGTITRELGKLVEVGLLRREKRGNQQVYSADTSCRVLHELASILRKTSSLVGVLGQAIAPVAHLLKLAFIFGAAAQERQALGIGVDLVLVGDLELGEAMQVLHPTRDVLGCEVSAQTFTVDEFLVRMLQTSSPTEVLQEPKLFLIGDARDLEDFSGHESRPGAHGVSWETRIGKAGHGAGSALGAEGEGRDGGVVHLEQ